MPLIYGDTNLILSHYVITEFHCTWNKQCF